MMIDGENIKKIVDLFVYQIYVEEFKSWHFIPKNSLCNLSAIVQCDGII